MSTKRSARLRGDIPPTVPTMTVSKFVRGGIYDLDQPMTIMSHGTELGTWLPRGQGAPILYASTGTSTPPAIASLSAGSINSNDAALTITLNGLNQSLSQLNQFLSTKTTEHEETKND